jgi:hypothetical protein
VRLSSNPSTVINKTQQQKTHHHNNKNLKKLCSIVPLIFVVLFAVLGFELTGRQALYHFGLFYHF